MFDFDEVISRAGTDAIKWEASGDAIPMWVADMEFKAPPAVLKAIEDRAAHGIFGYTKAPEGWYDAYIRWWSDRHAFSMQKEWLLFCNGIVPAITAMIPALSEPGDRVMVMSPVYNMFFNCIHSAGREMLDCPLLNVDGRYEIDWPRMEEGLACPDTTVLILCSPHNPVSRIWSREELEKLGALCARHHVTVIADEIHCDLTAPGVSYIPFASVSEECRMNSVTCLAPSKAFNIAGLQTAAICVADVEKRERIRQALHAMGLDMPNVFACIAAEAAFNEGGQWLDELRAYLWENRRAAAEQLKVLLPKAVMTEGDATYLMWLDIRAYTMDTHALCEALRTRFGVMVNDGGAYGEGGRGFLRINVACPRSMMEKGLACLAEGILNF